MIRLILRVLALLVLGFHPAANKLIDVALHAQVAPSNEMIVGSVITTNGIKAALDRRKDVGRVEIFYPGQTAKFFDREWDLVVIEGYFLSIDGFLRLTRISFPNAKIVFYLLDPQFPGLHRVRHFDIDGLLSNSEMLLEREQHNIVSGVPHEYLPLAADEVEMRPQNNVTREWGAVFVGAGGSMLELKPKLYKMLLDALPHRLRLHGGSWENVPILKDVALGLLPQHELSVAYSSASVVLASTISGQEKFGMINNRIFEALACGAVVVTPYTQTLFDFAKDNIVYTNETYSVQNALVDYTGHRREDAERLRVSARQFILARHTWSHRVVQLLDFFYHMKSPKQEAQKKKMKALSTNAYVHAHPETNSDMCPESRCSRGTNCPKLLWITSDGLASHQDSAFVEASLGSHLCGTFVVTAMSQHRWTDAITSSCQYAPRSTQRLRKKMQDADPSNIDAPTKYSEACIRFLSAFDVVFAVVTPYDELDISMRWLTSTKGPARSIKVRGTSLVQKRASYLIGVSSSLIENMQEESVTDVFNDNDDDDTYKFGHYDVVWYRDSFEKDLLQRLGLKLHEERMVHAFGPTKIKSETEPFAYGSASNVFICFWVSRSLCTLENRMKLWKSQQQDQGGDAESSSRERSFYASQVLLLLGGSWVGWLDVPGVVDGASLSDVVFARAGSFERAIEVIQCAGSVFILNEQDSHSIVVGDWRAAVRSDGAVTDARSSLAVVDTMSDVLWPFVVALVELKPIHFFQRNAHLLELAEDAVNWTPRRFKASVNEGLSKLFSLASVHAKADLTVVTNFDHCVDCDASSLAYVQKVKSMAGFSLAVLQFTFANFDVGVHGQLCIQQLASASSTPHNYPLCYSRPFRQTLVVPQLSESDTVYINESEWKKVSDDRKNVILHVSFRGVLFLDTTSPQVYVIEIPPEKASDNWLRNRDRVLQQQQTQGPDFDHILVFTVKW